LLVAVGAKVQIIVDRLVEGRLKIVYGNGLKADDVTDVVDAPL
jgi:hypothetical protein